jgi:hypothetical protein
MSSDEVTFKFVNMQQALMFRASLQTLADFLPRVDEAIREYAHLDTARTDKGEIQNWHSDSVPFQNRVTPFGDIVALSGRGLLMGNRGILHGDERRIVRRSQTRRWIACVLNFRGIHRTIMRPHSYTELFFLDEATALSAGHRPCAECRREDYRRFRALWETCHGAVVNVDGIDNVLHDERGRGRNKPTYHAQLAALPDGTFIALDERAWLLWRGEMLAWSDSGYSERRTCRGFNDVEVLTPRSIVAVLSAGYEPMVHPSAIGEPG